MEGMGARTATDAAVKKVKDDHLNPFQSVTWWRVCTGLGGVAAVAPSRFFFDPCAHIRMPLNCVAHCSSALLRCRIGSPGQRMRTLSRSGPGGPSTTAALCPRCAKRVSKSLFLSCLCVLCLVPKVCGISAKVSQGGGDMRSREAGLTPSVFGQRSCVQFGRKRCRDLRRGHWRDWQLRLPFLIQLPINYGLLTAGHGSVGVCSTPP